MVDLAADRVDRMARFARRAAIAGGAGVAIGFGLALYLDEWQFLGVTGWLRVREAASESMMLGLVSWLFMRFIIFMVVARAESRKRGGAE